MSTEPQTHNVVSTRVFDAPVATVWKAWSDSEQVRRWWGPQGFTSPLAQMDFREGGTSLVCMRAPAEYGGMDMYNTWTYTTIIPLERIEFVNKFTDKDGGPLGPGQMPTPPGVPSEVPHVITFKPIGANQTEMTVTEFGYTSAEAHDLSKGGLEQCLDKMAESFK
jgi:uncharacterized protein YndB with AHSA1/START domain